MNCTASVLLAMYFALAERRGIGLDRLGGTIQNAGNGDINLIAGWDGSTLDPAHFTDPDVPLSVLLSRSGRSL